MDHGALDDALEAGGRLGVVAIGGGQRRQVGVDVERQRRLQRHQVDVAGGHHIGRVGVVHEGQQQVLQRRILVPTLVGVVHRPVQGLFERTGKRGHLGSSQSFSIVHCRGCWWRRAVSTTWATLVSATS